MTRLKNKVCVITGAAGDIGTAAAVKFIEEGAYLFLVDRDEDRLSDLKDKIDSGRVFTFVADITNKNEVDALFKLANNTFGGIDCVLANAGVSGPTGQTVIQCSEEDFDKVININIKGAWLTIKAAAPYLIARGGGSIVLTSSVAGVVGLAGASPYVVSKHALTGLTKTAAAELAAYNVRVNSINPAPVESRMMDDIEIGFGGGVKTDSIKEAVLSTIPLGRYAHTSDVANFMLFLASDESGFCTGSVYMIDGGISAI